MIFRRRQPELIERYWARLRRERATAAPEGLDPRLSALVNALERDLEPLDASDTFARALEGRLQAQLSTSNNHRAWTGPAVDATRTRRPARSINETEEQRIMSDITRTQPEPIPLPQRRWFREGLEIAAALLVFAVIGAIVVLVVRGDNGKEHPIVPGAGTPTPVASPTAPVNATAQAARDQLTATANAAAPATAQIFSSTATAAAAAYPAPGTTVATIPVGKGPRNPVATDTAIWVANDFDGTISRIDPATNTVAATIRVAARGSLATYSVVADDTAVWATAAAIVSGATIVHIDPATNRVVGRFTPPQPVAWLAIGFGSLWARVFGADQILRIDPDTGSVIATIPAPDAWDLTFSTHAVWVLRRARPELMKIDPATNMATTVTYSSSADDVADMLRAAGDNIWIAGHVALLRVDAATGQVAERSAYPEPVDGILIDSGDDALWVFGSPSAGGEVAWKFDLAAHAWVAAGSAPTILQRVTYTDGALWCVTEDAMAQGTVVRIDPTP